MLNITVLEGYNENNLVEIEFDGEVSQREMDAKELNATIQDAKAKLVNISFEEPTEVKTVLLEEYDGEFDITLMTFTYNSLTDYDYKDEAVKSYKRENSAYKKMLEVAKENNCSYVVSNC